MTNLTSQLAAKQLGLKMRLEPRLKREMTAVFRAISNDMRVLYSTRGAVLNVSEFEPEINNILKQHYRRVAVVFGKTLRREVAKSAFSPEEFKQIDDEVDSDLREFIETTTRERSQEITATTQRDINASVASALAAPLADDDAFTQIDNVQVGADAQKEFNLKTRSRPTTISVTETQTASEGSKFTEALGVAFVAASLANVTPESLIEKEWVAVLDSKTRISHVLTDGQRMGINSPFNVDGDRMNTPGDSSLGASAGNIINCRCIAAYIVKNIPVVEAVDTRLRPTVGAPNATVQGIVGL